MEEWGSLWDRDFQVSFLISAFYIVKLSLPQPPATLSVAGPWLLGFDRRPWQRWQDTCDYMYMTLPYDTATHILGRYSFSYDDLKKQVAMLCVTTLESQGDKDDKDSENHTVH